jgi:hypothetical protein
MATTTNYGWTTPNDTDLVKDGAAAIRTLGSSVDTTTKALNPSTTLGDIEYRSATANTNTRLGIGSSGNVLTVAGGVPTWAAPAGSGASWSQLAVSATTSGTTVTISGLSGYNQLYVQFENVSHNDSIKEFSFRVNADSGTNYNFVEFLTRNVGSICSGNYVSGGTEIGLGRTANAGNSMSGGILINGANSTGKKFFTGFMASVNDLVNSDITKPHFSGTYDGTSVISSVSIVTNAAAFDAGNMRVFGSVA